MKVTADREVCVGSGMCVMTAPEVFDQDDDGIVVPLVEDVDEEDVNAAQRAVAQCPSSALRALE